MFHWQKEEDAHFPSIYLPLSYLFFSVHQVPDTDQLSVRQRTRKQPAVRQQSLADVAMELPNSSNKCQHRDLKRILSEPLFNHLRDKLQKIRKKRASSEPLSLEAIRQRKRFQQNPVSFQIGEQQGKTSSLKKKLSPDSAAECGGKTARSPQGPKLSSSPSKESIPEDEAIAIKANNDIEMLSAHPPPEEHEEKNDPRSTFGESKTKTKKNRKRFSNSLCKW